MPKIPGNTYCLVREKCYKANFEKWSLKKTFDVNSAIRLKMPKYVTASF